VRASVQVPHILLLALLGCGRSQHVVPVSAPPDDRSGTDAGVAVQPPPSPDGGQPSTPDAGDQSQPPTCLASPVLADLGAEQRLLVGADMSESVAELAPFDIRYLYLAGGLADGDGPCARCDSSCTAGGVSCSASSGPTCGWWGCWQDPALPPGEYARDLLRRTQAAGQIPLISYYELLQTTKVTEGSAEIVALRDVALMTRYFNDWRFVLGQIGKSRALLHVEPDLWGYAERVAADPHQIAAAVRAANPTDCAGHEDSVAGLGRCLIAMVRKYAPSAKVGLHASAWGTGVDVHENTDSRLDVAAEGRRLADFLLACGAGDSDFVVVEASDRDAGFYKSIGRATFWDATNATLPNFRQAFAWTRAVTERIGHPALFWQLPLGNMSLPNVTYQWQDNRVDYFFSHPGEVASTNAFGMVFGAGAEGQTNPSTDRGNFVTRVQQLAAAGGQAACQ
jgi:hypothetical protein